MEDGGYYGKLPPGPKISLKRSGTKEVSDLALIAQIRQLQDQLVLRRHQPSGEGKDIEEPFAMPSTSSPRASERAATTMKTSEPGATSTPLRLILVSHVLPFRLAIAPQFECTHYEDLGEHSDSGESEVDADWVNPTTIQDCAICYAECQAKYHVSLEDRTGLADLVSLKDEFPDDGDPDDEGDEDNQKLLPMWWVGWPEFVVRQPWAQRFLTEELALEGFVPVFLNKEGPGHSGLCGNLLWPLLHYIPINLSTLLSVDTLFQHYEQANQAFASAVLQTYHEGDIVWVHDYQLMLVPAILRRQRPDMKIGFYLHTPFPSSEVFRTLPHRVELMQGLLAADLLGFGTHDYIRHFGSVLKILFGLSPVGDTVTYRGHTVRFGTFPKGINAERFVAALSTPGVQAKITALTEKFRGRKIILGLDKLDQVRGIPQKLHAVERLLETYPQWREKIVLVQLVKPGGEGSSGQTHLENITHEIVGRINGRFGSEAEVPIHYLDRSQFKFEELCALYFISDVLLITSLRDGSSLAAYEYVASQGKNGKGVLVLSEFTGAADALGAGAVQVNPMALSEVAKALDFALSMKETRRKALQRYALNHVMTHTVRHWAMSFVRELRQTRRDDDTCEGEETKCYPTPLDTEAVVRAFRRSKRRLIITGVFNSLTELRPGGFGELSPDMAHCIKTLTEDDKTTYLCLTSRSRTLCEFIMGHTRAWLAAENGYFLKTGADSPWQVMHANMDLSWKAGSVMSVFDYYTSRTPGSYIQNLETHMSWNYSRCDKAFGRRRANELVSHLTSGPLSNTPTEVTDNNCVVQVRPLGVSKGILVKSVLNMLQQNAWELMDWMQDMKVVDGSASGGDGSADLSASGQADSSEASRLHKDDSGDEEDGEGDDDEERQEDKQSAAGPHKDDSGDEEDGEDEDGEDKQGAAAVGSEEGARQGKGDKHRAKGRRRERRERRRVDSQGIVWQSSSSEEQRGVSAVDDKNAHGKDNNHDNNDGAVANNHDDRKNAPNRKNARSTRDARKRNSNGTHNVKSASHTANGNNNESQSHHSSNTSTPSMNSFNDNINHFYSRRTSHSHERRLFAPTRARCSSGYQRGKPPSGTAADFVLCIGHFTNRDEDVFRMLNSMEENNGEMPIPVPFSEPALTKDPELISLLPSFSPSGTLTLAKHQSPPSCSFATRPKRKHPNAFRIGGTLHIDTAANSPMGSQPPSPPPNDAPCIFTCTSQGRVRTHARYYVESALETKQLLSRLATEMAKEQKKDASPFQAAEERLEKDRKKERRKPERGESRAT